MPAASFHCLVCSRSINPFTPVALRIEQLVHTLELAYSHGRTCGEWSEVRVAAGLSSGVPSNLLGRTNNEQGRLVTFSQQISEILDQHSFHCLEMNDEFVFAKFLLWFLGVVGSFCTLLGFFDLRISRCSRDQ
ncbi:hypothetical protein SCHPADRAFT_757137 [Schizopora paradoxa]|uniref:Uncharacterized protein n=1 Tax=Schizopora paradoxa TaxID=27342 RepID=A0A0H2QY42_9AGAM|nr:hypothetical protein SCHPADRAFT_757137 [Schizopora paradoxa]